MGGVGFLKAISPRGRTEYPVLVLTARAQLAESFGNVDVDGFIVKPCDPNDLLMEVNRIVFSAGHAVPTEGRPDGAVGGKILLGEDDAREAERLRADLARQGYAVEAVRTGPELLERAIQHQPDVVVMNVVLGKMNGEAVAGILREMPKTGAIPVILYHTSSISIPEDRYGKASNIRKVIASDKTVDLQSGIREVLSRGGGSRR
jgi:CheY-like chemotaxis protein